MNEYLQRLGYDFWKTKVGLPAELEDTLNEGFHASNDCVILKGLYGHNSNPDLKSDLEKCEWEYHETHLHIDDYFQSPDDEISLLSLGLEYAKRIRARLDEEFDGKKFRILLSFSETNKNEIGQVDSYGSCTVRFHQIRPNCDEVMKTDNLEKFQLEAVMEIEK